MTIKKTFDASRYLVSRAKPTPVLLLLDVSGSMGQVLEGTYKSTGRTIFEDGRDWNIVHGGTSRIDLLNQAMQEMIASFVAEERHGREYLVTVITFGQEVTLHQPPMKASEIREWRKLSASGETPLGAAITLAKSQIEDKEIMPTRAFKPVVILVSDGRPTDEWKEPLSCFMDEGRSSKCDRMAMAIGTGTDEAMLGNFASGTGNRLFYASDAAEIVRQFRELTMTVTVRSRALSVHFVEAAAGAAPAADDSEYW